MPSKKELLNPITSQILAQNTCIQVTCASTIEGKVEEIKADIVTVALDVAKLGYRYLDLKAACEHGQFIKILNDLGVSQTTVKRQMEIARFFASMPESNRPALGVLKPSQINELTRLPDEKKQTLTLEEIQEFGQLSYRKLGALVKQINLDFDDAHKLEAQNTNLKHQLNEAQLQAAQAITELNRERVTKAPDTVFGLPPLVAHIVENAPALSQSIACSTLNVVNLIEQLRQPGLDHTQALQAAKAIYHFVMAPHTQLGVALGDLLDHFGENHFGDTAALPIYDELQWADANAKRKSIIDIHDARFNPSKKKGRK